MDILLVGQADSIFFEHYSKNIKARCSKINLDVFSIDALHGKHDLSAFNNVFATTWNTSVLSKIKVVRALIHPFYTWICLYSFLRKTQKKYDIVHFKWLVPSVTLFPGLLTKFYNKSVATFWGGEFLRQKLLYSGRLYKLLLTNFLRRIDVITYCTTEEFQDISKLINSDKCLSPAIYGSSIYSELEHLIASESKNRSKELLGILPDKITVSIGYSGKRIHRHVSILKTLLLNDRFAKTKDIYYFLLPMTYGCEQKYIDEVERLLIKYNIEYSIYKNKLTDIQVARIRNATDIMIQLSVADGRSASIIESLLAGAILISGSWLPYQVFKEKHLYFHEIDNIDKLPDVMNHITSNIDIDLSQCQNNKIKWGFETWDKTIGTWLNIYAYLAEPENSDIFY